MKTYQIFPNRIVDFDDRKVARECLKEIYYKEIRRQTHDGFYFRRNDRTV